MLLFLQEARKNGGRKNFTCNLVKKIGLERKLFGSRSWPDGRTVYFRFTVSGDRNRPDRRPKDYQHWKKSYKKFVHYWWITKHFLFALFSCHRFTAAFFFRPLSLSYLFYVNIIFSNAAALLFYTNIVRNFLKSKNIDCKKCQ